MKLDQSMSETELLLCKQHCPRRATKQRKLQKCWLCAGKMARSEAAGQCGCGGLGNGTNNKANSIKTEQTVLTTHSRQNRIRLLVICHNKTFWLRLSKVACRRRLCEWKKLRFERPLPRFEQSPRWPFNGCFHMGWFSLWKVGVDTRPLAF